MKHLKYIFMAFAVALLAASCSQDELLDDGGTEEVWIMPSKHRVTIRQGI